MKAEQSSKSPASDETTSQKQDPLERRRLQNRLSQRNHRRKIRDRIAKLQERVIANELRAAAGLNGWDQPYCPSPLPSPRHTVHQPPTSNDIEVNSRDTSPITTEPSTPFNSTYNMAQIPAWSSDLNLAQSSGWLTGDLPYTADSRGFLNETMCYTSEQSISTGIQLPMGDFHDIDLSPESYSSPCLMPTALNPGSPITQPLYYAATVSALPQVLQAMSSMSPQAKIIVLVPSESASTYPALSSSILGGNGLEVLSPSPPALRNVACMCQAQSTSIAPNGVQGLSRWAAHASLSTGCPLHKISSPSMGSFSSNR
ncbi:uncharacterized protein N7469_010960 [Penicillium citrinum]|uniref:BZIP domain-containing protein n=1 Tax=Penicillium citrinum TaxID=5077 RepID=A0A9W9NLP4_PENCI|nr:uncharacterized protein N7469_010960 [Penicillium citrinum]KAJ5222073.1 hypothetical protein N7469_010960 [Penicillium citrinum]